MSNRRSLGRGLSSLIPDVKEEKKDLSQEELGEDFSKVLSLPLDKIRPRDGQPRKDFDPKALEDLAQSIEEYGLLNPITVTKVGDHYEILAGERRYRASLLNKAETIDAIVKDFEDKDVEVLSLIENVQRLLDGDQPVGHLDQLGHGRRRVLLCGGLLLCHHHS